MVDYLQLWILREQEYKKKIFNPSSAVMKYNGFMGTQIETNTTGLKGCIYALKAQHVLLGLLTFPQNHNYFFISFGVNKLALDIKNYQFQNKVYKMYCLSHPSMWTSNFCDLILHFNFSAEKSQPWKRGGATRYVPPQRHFTGSIKYVLLSCRVFETL